MNYPSTEVFESKLMPGVKFRLRRMSHGRRMEYNELAAEVFAELQEMDRERDPLIDEIRAAEQVAKNSPCTCEHPAEEHDATTGRCRTAGCSCRAVQGEVYRQSEELALKALTVIVNKLYPARIRWGLKTIEGLEIDDRPATIDTFLEAMPDAVIAELATEIDRLMKLSAEEQLTFKSPTTSAAAVDGQNPLTSAATAN